MCSPCEFCAPGTDGMRVAVNVADGKQLEAIANHACELSLKPNPETGALTPVAGSPFLASAPQRIALGLVSAILGTTSAVSATFLRVHGAERVEGSVRASPSIVPLSDGGENPRQSGVSTPNDYAT